MKQNPLTNPLGTARRKFLRGLPIDEAGKRALMVPDGFVADHAGALMALTTLGHLMRHNAIANTAHTPAVTTVAINNVLDMLTIAGITEWLADAGKSVAGGSKAVMQLGRHGGGDVAFGRVEAVMVLMSYVLARRPAIVREISQVTPHFRPWRELVVEINAADAYVPSQLADLIDQMRRVLSQIESSDVRRLIVAVAAEVPHGMVGAAVSPELVTGVPDVKPAADDGAAVGEFVSQLVKSGLTGTVAVKHAEAVISAIHNRDAGWLGVALDPVSGMRGAPVRAGYARALFTAMTGVELHTDSESGLQYDLDQWASSNKETRTPDHYSPPESMPGFPPATPAERIPPPPAADVFKAKYGVNDEQAVIVQDRSPFVVVPSAAGSGKTRTVTSKIRFLIEETGTQPDDIRIVAFNKHAATEISARLRSLIGKDSTESVDPMTTHKFAMKYGTLTSAEIDATVFPSGTPRIRHNGTTVFLPSQPELLRAAYVEAVERSNLRVNELGINMRTALRFIDNYKNFGMTLTEYLRQWRPRMDDPEDGPKVRFLVMVTLLYEEQKGYTDREHARYGEEFDRLYSDFMAPPKNPDTEVLWKGRVRSALGNGATVIRHDLTDWVSEMYESVTAKEYDDPRAVSGKADRLRRMQEKHKVLIVDESQDLAPVQVMLYRAIGLNRNIPGSQYVRVGDDAQCVDGTTLVTLKENGVKVSRAVCDVKAGDRVLAWSVGRRKFRRVTQCWKTSHPAGYSVQTDSGKTLLMSPNHKIYAALPLPGHRWYTYLMYREDMGFRIGITQLQNSQGVPFARANQEMADCVWLIGAHDDCESALLQETQLSLKYGIPTYVFYSRTGTDQSRINSVFREFGANGARLLTDIGASIDHPCWISGGTTRSRTKRRVNLLVHGTYKGRWEKHEVVHESDAGRIRRNFNNYDTAVMEAQKIAEQVGARVSERLHVEGVKLYLTTACCVQPGMRLHTVDGIETVKSVSIEVGEFYDLDVDGSRNFFGNGILSHNSIYGFRGATPEEFVSDARQPGATQLTIASNYRSYEEIVRAADLLINRNQVQIPKNTIAARGPGGAITASQGPTFESIVAAVTERIQSNLVRSGGQYLDIASKRPLFAIVCRTRRELDDFEDELAINDISYVRKGGKPFWLKGDVGGVVDLLKAAYVLAGKISMPAREQNETLTRLIKWPYRPGAPKKDQATLYYAPFNGDAPIKALAGIKGAGDVYYDRAKNAGRTSYDFWPTFVALRNDLQRIVSQMPNLNNMLLAILEGESRGYDGDSVADLLVKSTLTEGDDEADTDDESNAADAGPSRNGGGVAVFDKIARFAERLGLVDQPQELISAIMQRTQAALRIQERIKAGDQEAIPAVSLSTIHMTKGLEYENVFMVANADNFPAPVRGTDSLLVNPGRVAQYHGGIGQLKLEEERRLAYTAMTRAMRNLEIYTSRTTPSGAETEPSQFIAEAGIVLGQLGGDRNTPVAEAHGHALVSESLAARAANMGF